MIKKCYSMYTRNNMFVQAPQSNLKFNYSMNFKKKLELKS